MHMEQSVVRDRELIGTLQRYADLFTFAPVGSVVLTEDSRVEEINRTAASMLGLPRGWIAGQLFSRWVAKGDAKRFLEHLRNACHSHQPLSDEFHLTDRRGRTRDVRFDSVAMIAREQDSAGKLGRCNVTMTDVTEQRWVSRDGLNDAAHAARLNSCGEMAAALAHELSHPLGAIALYCNAAKNGLGSGRLDEEQLTAIVDKITAAASHANATVQGLRAYLSKREASTEDLDINTVVRDASQLAAPYAKERSSRVELRLTDGLPSVRANRVHVQQVLLNLLQNSVDAMHQIATDARRVVVVSDRPEPDLVRVTVADCGPGMTDQQRRQAFEPFYTTKKDGMGMGLSISRSIIESYGGRLWAPKTRQGTTLSFTLPANERH
jgi:C4-dicarboxylate-specific signal transduction histidine kinase